MGLTLTALVLILNAPASFHAPLGPISGQDYFELVVSYVAIVGGMSSIGLLSFLDVAGGLSTKGGFVDQFGTVLFFLSVFGFLGALPLLLAPFTRVGALVILIMEVALLLAYAIGRRLSPSSLHNPPARK